MNYMIFLFSMYTVVIPVLCIILFFTRFSKTTISSVVGAVSMWCWVIGGVTSVFILAFGIDTLMGDAAVRVKLMTQFIQVYSALFWYVVCLLLSKELLGLPALLSRQIKRIPSLFKRGK